MSAQRIIKFLAVIVTSFWFAHAWSQEATPPSSSPLDDRRASEVSDYVVAFNSYVVEIKTSQGREDVVTAASVVLGDTVIVEPLFSDIDLNDDPEGLSKLYRVRVAGTRSSGAQWDAAYAIKKAGGFEQVEPDTATAIEDARKRQAATASCLLDDGVPAPNEIAWSLVQMRVPEARELQPPPAGRKDGEGIRICHPDSGWTDHVDLDRSRIDTTASLNLIEGGSDARDPLNYSGHPGHGTGTGSVIISAGGFEANGGTTGPGQVNGLAPRATLVPIRALKSVVHVFDSDIAKAVRHASKAKCDVISMSLGGAGFFGLKKAIREAVGRDIIVVSAAGNCAGFVVAPASYESVIAVAATNAARKPWPGSSQGKAVDISAPGEDIYVARTNSNATSSDKVRTGSGTSFSTAAVAGAAANWLAFHGEDAIKQSQGGLTRQQLFMLALSNSADASPAGWDKRRMGAGILDLHKLLIQPLPNGGATFTVAPRYDHITEIAQRLDLDRSLVEQGLRRILGQPDNLEATLIEFGAEIVDIASRNPASFRAAIQPPDPGAFSDSSKLLRDSGSTALKRELSQ
ncbi:MAG: S8 family serine peptidase [Xanthomonadaceae bacterium]|nr:S8 family serine peptidase [Xanthomonadaceae bacterium]